VEKYDYREAKYATLTTCPGVQCGNSPTCAFPSELCDKKITCMNDVASPDEFKSCGITYNAGSSTNYNSSDDAVSTPLLVANENQQCVAAGQIQCKQ
jgi:hypothetical protein